MQSFSGPVLPVYWVIMCKIWVLLCVWKQHHCRLVFKEKQKWWTLSWCHSRPLPFLQRCSHSSARPKCTSHPFQHDGVGCGCSVHFVDAAGSLFALGLDAMFLGFPWQLHLGGGGVALSLLCKCSAGLQTFTFNNYSVRGVKFMRTST